MTWLRGQLQRGVFRQGWISAAVCVALGVAVYLVSKVYALLNHGPSVIFLRTPIDAAMPLVKVFVIPYISLEPLTYVSLLLFLLFRVRIFQSAALSMIGAWLVSYTVYFFLQSVVVRPDVAGDDLLSRLLRDVYAGDQPYNDFPSLHTSLSTILAIHWLRVDRRLGTVVAVWVALIVLSTMFVHQHYIADVLGGLVLAFGFSMLFLRKLGADAHG